MTDEQRAMLNKVMSDPVEFCKRLRIKLKDGRYELFGKLMTKSQEDLIRTICSGEHKRIAIVKARQMGITTAVRAASFYLTYTSSDAFKCAVIAPVSETAEEVFDMDRIFYDTLPPILQRDIKRKKNTLRFPTTNSYIKTFSAGGDGEMRGFTLNFAHLTEFAFYKDPMAFRASVLAATHGTVVIESTPNYFGDALHETWDAAEKDGGWHLVFLPWFSYPDYTVEDDYVPHDFKPTEEEQEMIDEHGITFNHLQWRRNKIAEFSGDIHKFRKEYPISVEDAYSQSDDNFFGPWHFEQVEERQIGKQMIERLDGWSPHDTYVMGVDLAGGVGQDYSVACVVSRMTNSPVAFIYTNQMSIRDFAGYCKSLAAEYRAQIHYEQNNHGYAFAEALYHLGVQTAAPHHTSSKSKLQIYGILRSFLEEGMIDHLDTMTLREMRELIKDPKGLAPEHPPGKHDDRVIAYAIALYYIKDKPQPRSNLQRIIHSNQSYSKQQQTPTGMHKRNTRSLRRF